MNLSVWAQRQGEQDAGSKPVLEVRVTHRTQEHFPAVESLGPVGASDPEKMPRTPDSAAGRDSETPS